MADSNRRPSDEQVRIDYRKQIFMQKQLSKADAGLALNKPTIRDQIPGDEDGLMPKVELDKQESIKLLIPLWPDRPDAGLPPVFFNTLTLEWRNPADVKPEYKVFHTEQVPGPDTLPDANFPLTRELPFSDYHTIEGKIEVRYRVSGWNAPVETESDHSPITLDRIGPIRPGVPEKIIVNEPLITTAILEAVGGIACLIPDFDEEKKGFVTLAVALLDKPPTGELDPDELAYLGPLPLTRAILIPKALVYGMGSMLMYIVYFLFDKAGNRSDMPFPTEVQVALGDLPLDLKPAEVPLAADDLIDRADAAFPTTVRIRQFTNPLDADGILITWGENNLPRTPVSAHKPFPLDITVPWEHLKAEYDFAAGGTQEINVDYAVLRGDYPIASPGAIQVKVNLEITGPENPNPDPENPKLGLVRFNSFSNSDKQLTPADIGEAATGYITLTAEILASVLADDVLTLFWNGKAVTSTPYKIKGDETVDQEIPLVIPWADIEETPVMDQLPLRYSLTRPGLFNPQTSLPTFIDVEVETVDLPEPEFPDKDADPYPINCNALIEKDGKWGVRVHIPASAHLKEGVEVTATWQTYGKDKVTELPNTSTSDLLTVSKQEEQDGVDWFIPYERFLKPTYDTGDQYGWGKVIYQIKVRGTPVNSDLVEVMIAVFEHGDHCVIPRP
ncbi:hypothetical protein IMF27_04180 [Pseudomonas sp. PCH199]|uniref:hypothetical protein n=1 Tax=unclassified Pseudomonas TaxID=196821 RepID=UPI000BCFE7F0|nr:MULTISPECIES: hypothetical protein [unclassified Pseudomonas]MCW8274994.1 hypothetical protein [Pseudomonas sp. PCH199]PAM84673.1 hypothetical protein CES87_04280 [Pseudomonas sp. ERMR1:02]